MERSSPIRLAQLPEDEKLGRKKRKKTSSSKTAENAHDTKFFPVRLLLLRSSIFASPNTQKKSISYENIAGF